MTVKQQIVETSLEQFLKYGIRKMTIQKLIAPLGISTKTVYKYFSDKEKLLKECLTLHYARMFEKIEMVEQSSPNPVASLCNLWNQALAADFGVNHAFYHDLNDYYPALQDAVFARNSKKTTLAITSILRQGTTEGLFRKGLKPLLVLKAMGVMYNSLTRTGEFKKLGLDPALLAEHTIFTYLRGICTPKGIHELESFNQSK